MSRPLYILKRGREIDWACDRCGIRLGKGVEYYYQRRTAKLRARSYCSHCHNMLKAKLKLITHRFSLPYAKP